MNLESDFFAKLVNIVGKNLLKARISLGALKWVQNGHSLLIVGRRKYLSRSIFYWIHLADDGAITFQLIQVL